MMAATTSAGQSFDKLKVLVEEIAREWANAPAAVAVPHFSIKHRRECAQIPERDRISSAGSLNGSLSLSSGERRILTALAQYPQGRSKVQVAVLTGYAPNGGGFNNYLGALRSRALIKGDGDRLTITDTGIETLGSWDPLPTGSALIEYWRSRLGKAERLILETLQPGVSQCTHQRASRGRGRIRSEWWRFQQRPGSAEDSGASRRPRRDQGQPESFRCALMPSSRSNFKLKSPGTGRALPKHSALRMRRCLKDFEMSLTILLLGPDVDPSWPRKIMQAVAGVVAKAFTNANDAAADLETAEAAYGTVPPELFARAKNLRWICAARAGLGGSWFYEALVKSDVVVTNMRGSYNEHLAAHAVAFLLAFARRFDHYLPERRWQRGPQMIDLPAQTVLIVGVGGAGGRGQ